MSKGVITTVIGVAEVIAGIALEFVPGGQAVGAFLIKAGSGLVLVGIGTMLAGSSGSSIKESLGKGVAVATRNSIAARNVIYGRTRKGGLLISIDPHENESCPSS